jgi:integrase/recombinase XerD
MRGRHCHDGAEAVRVSRRFIEFKVQAAQGGPHALRHACATRLLANGLTPKEIGEHLGHRTTGATRTYAKVYTVFLCEVGAFDLEDLP